MASAWPAVSASSIESFFLSRISRAPPGRPRNLMSPKARPPVIRSVKKPEALSALRTWLTKFDEQTRERGEEYYAAGQVKNVGSDADHYVEAKVQGESLYPVTLVPHA